MEPSFIYEAKGRTLVIHLPRELDHHNCRNLKYETDLLMAENYISRILFDFTGTEFMDSSGIGILLNRYKEMKASGGKTCLYGAGPQVLRVLKIAGIPALMEMYDSEVAVFLSRMDPTLEEIEDVKTAVSEAVTNAVIHGYQGGEGTITLEVSVEEDVLTVLVQDEGVGIRDVAKAMEPMYTTAPDGERSGMGFSFMEAFMDQVEVVSAPGSGTTVTMRKKIGR